MCACVYTRVLVLAALAGSAGWCADGEVVVSGGGGAAGSAGAAPSFAGRQRTAAVAARGQTATLDCRVLHLADKSVSWVRSSDLQILSHAGAVFTADSRVSASSGAAAAAGGTRHTLRIERLRTSDAGSYECQINTEPKMSLFFNLTVLDEPVPVMVVSPVYGDDGVGDGVVMGYTGGAATLACSAHYEPPPRRLLLPPIDIRWTKDGQLINLQSSRGGISLDTERWEGRAVSRLTLAALAARDAGTYACAAGDVYTLLRLHVADADSDPEEQLNAMQRDQSAVAHTSSACAARGGYSLALTLQLALAALLVAATALPH